MTTEEKAKKIIEEHSKEFGGSLNDKECRKLAGIARNTFYKYKNEIKEEKSVVMDKTLKFSVFCKWLRCTTLNA